ncbi:class I SAM-dependent methyltransferase [Butyrivibrio sp. XB500-5]|uniref:class I SAM-dependent methyltransferase n=1 Tax=Butyrivibrio sp. XB500-5 TaxID=2364880 RepID=UPI001314ED69|nr:class I SAM-dependent methyltransferase [Butyrivibrio sp. XB500-5]
MERHHIVWNSENVNRLWDYTASCNVKEDSYFGYQVGEAIVHFCTFFVEDINKCNVLDYGSGMGHIIGKFLDKKVHVTGVDMSGEEVDRVNKKYADNKFFHGVKLFDGGRLPFNDNEFDLITCTEVIEHVLDEHIDNLLNELYRVMKPGGIVLFTTPNNENIEESERCCPECNTIFHVHGHVRSFSKETIEKMLEEHNYATILCDATDYEYIQRYLHCPSLLDLSIRQMIRRLKRSLIDIQDIGKKNINSHLFSVYVGLKRKPHLFYVGTKK